MKAIQVFFLHDKESGEVGNGARKQTLWQSNAPPVWMSICHSAAIQRSPGAPAIRRAHRRGPFTHTINILLLFIGHLGSGKTCPAQRFKSWSKAPLFLGLV